MILFSLGIIAPTSISVATQATANLPVPTNSTWVESLSFQALGTNTGTVFICDRANPDLTVANGKGIGVLWELPAPSGSTSRPAWVIGDPSRPNNPIDISMYYIVPSVSGEGVRGAAIRSGTKQI
jgi:hypothetical protein